MFTLLRQIYPTPGKRTTLQSPMIRVIHRGYKKLAHKEHILISTHFSSHSNLRWILRENNKKNILIISLMRSHYPRRLWSVSQPKNLSPKTLNPKASSFGLPRFSLFEALTKIWRMRPYTMFRPRKNRVELVWIALRFEALYTITIQNLIQNRVMISANRSMIFQVTSSKFLNQNHATIS